MYLSNKQAPIIVERIIKCTSSDAWTALTELGTMKLWFFEMIPDFKAELGFTTSFNVEAPSRDYYHIWKVNEVKNNERISYTWTYKDMEGKANLTFEVIPNSENETKVKVINTILEDFPHYPEFTVYSCTEGWNYFMDRLSTFLTKQSS